jgi:hypothetical protein
MQIMIDIECNADENDHVMIFIAIAEFLAKLPTYNTNDLAHTFEVEILHNGRHMFIAGSSVGDDDNTQYVTVHRALRITSTPRRLALAA